MKTFKINYLLKIFLLLVFALFLSNCTTDSIEEELTEENLIESFAKSSNPCNCSASGGTDDGSEDIPEDKDGDGDPDITDPDPNDPCSFTFGSIGNPSNPIWANADCDGDGIPNISDNLPFSGFN